MRLLLLLALVTALGAGLFGCGDSGPDGSNGKAVEEFEDLGLSQEEAEAEVAAADREAAQEIRKDEARIRREVREEEQSAAKPISKPEQTPAQAAGFTGKYEEAYELALFACAFHPLERIAKEFQISPSANELEVAEAYAEGYYGRFEQGAFEGCIAGIEKRQAG